MIKNCKKNEKYYDGILKKKYFYKITENKNKIISHKNKIISLRTQKMMVYIISTQLLLLRMSLSLL